MISPILGESHGVDIYTNPQGAEVHLYIDGANKDSYNQSNEVSMVDCILPAGLFYHVHYHKQTAEIYRLLSGEAIIYIESGKEQVNNQFGEKLERTVLQGYRFEVGNIILLPKNTAHAIQAITAINVMAICAPQRIEDDVYDIPEDKYRLIQPQ